MPQASQAARLRLRRVPATSNTPPLLVDFNDYVWLTGAEAACLLEQLAGDDRPLHRRQASLRKSLPADRARLLTQQAELRGRAEAKFGPAAARMFFLPVQLEQATDVWTARYKATRFRPDRTVIDYCCGIGGDLLALTAQTRVEAWERDRITAHLAEANLAAAGEADSGRVRLGDATDHPPRADVAWHLDPDRRTHGRRTTRIEYYSPDAKVIEQWLAQAPHAGVKLAPAALPPPAWAAAAELEWITRDRQCRQLVLWSGDLAQSPGYRRATRVEVAPDGALLARSFVGAPDAAPHATDQPKELVFDPDPSVVAAGLVGAMAEAYSLESLGAGSVYLTGSRAVDQPLLTPLVVDEKLPLRPPVVAKYLRARAIGRVEIKIRGVTVDPGRFRKTLKLHGDGEAVLLLTRIGARQTALVCRRPT